ncbi:MAG: outer membrane protein assembly factor [Cytophagales bacterium]
MKRISALYIIILIGVSVVAFAQVDESIINYSKPQKYKIGGISVSGTQYLDPNAIIAITGLKVGDEVQVPGEQITAAINKLWDQGILGDIQFRVLKVEGDQIFFDVYLKERARLSKFAFFGIKKTEQDELKEKIKLNKGKIVTDVMIKAAQNKVRTYFGDKGYRNVKVNIQQARDSSNSASNTVTLRILINKGRKIRVDKVDFIGNTEANPAFVNRKTEFPNIFARGIYNVKYLFTSSKGELSDGRLRMKLKKTKNLNLVLFHVRSKFVKSLYEEDKKKLLEYYNTKGYRDFQITGDTVYSSLKNKKFVNLKINVSEGEKYYFRNINWTGNYKYESKYLNQVLGVQKGDIYNMSLLEKRLNYNPTGADISSLYMDDGYLFFNVDPQEVNIDKDSIDIEMRMYEGPQATINKINISGNTKTNEHVILREIRTRPGEKFSRADLIRTQREIATLGYFDPEQIAINPKPNPTNGTVDIDYGVVEKPSDQIELSGGWGGFYGFIGTAGISFNNFSARNIANFKKWSPLPAGDGQKVSLRLQANGPQYQSLSASFTEPWLGGSKPMSLTFSSSYSLNRLGVQTGIGGTSFGNQRVNQGLGGNRGLLTIFNASISLGRRIKWPDDYFTLAHTLSYSYYTLENYTFFPQYSNGVSNSLVFTNTLARNSIDNPTYPRKGSSLSLALSLTPPYSLISSLEYSDLSRRGENQYKLVEYYKVMFDAAFYLPIIDKLVFATRAHFGFIGKYNNAVDYSPYERFLLGGNGLSGFNFILGSDVIGLRGYQNNSIGPSPYSNNPALRSSGGVAYDKFVFELRYPISLSQAATVYVLAFAEGGNNWGSYAEFSPLNLKRVAGVGARIFMPAFGMIGVDYGYALDRENGEVLQPFNFTIGQQLR